MTPMAYNDDWVPPWKQGLPQARCVGINCTQDGIPGRLVVAITLDKDGLCRPCAQTADTSDQELRFGLKEA